VLPIVPSAVPLLANHTGPVTRMLHVCLRMHATPPVPFSVPHPASFAGAILTNPAANSASMPPRGLRTSTKTRSETHTLRCRVRRKRERLPSNVPIETDAAIKLTRHAQG
jgi:hypothetical protein